MQAIRGTYDGKTIRPLPTETLPEVEGEIPVEIVFLTEAEREDENLRRRAEAVKRMRAMRAAMEPLECGVTELIEDGRYR